ncbi:MAG: hypothetical protein HY547_06770 [Elusimicrobia bacterium]|nr:hypothetical protein [Elusimicrobiota bacterium]
MFLSKIFPLFTSNAWACAVCFGKSDSSLSKAFTWGIAAMLGPTFAILIVLVFAINKIEKRHRHLSNQSLTQD